MGQDDGGVPQHAEGKALNRSQPISLSPGVGQSVVLTDDALDGHPPSTIQVDAVARRLHSGLASRVNAAKHLRILGHECSVPSDVSPVAPPIATAARKENAGGAGRRDSRALEESC